MYAFRPWVLLLLLLQRRLVERFVSIFPQAPCDERHLLAMWALCGVCDTQRPQLLSLACPSFLPHLLLLHCHCLPRDAVAVNDEYLRTYATAASDAQPILEPAQVVAHAREATVVLGLLANRRMHLVVMLKLLKLAPCRPQAPSGAAAHRQQELTRRMAQQLQQLKLGLCQHCSACSSRRCRRTAGTPVVQQLSLCGGSVKHLPLQHPQWSRQLLLHLQAALQLMLTMRRRLTLRRRLRHVSLSGWAAKQSALVRRRLCQVAQMYQLKAVEDVLALQLASKWVRDVRIMSQLFQQMPWSWDQTVGLGS